MLTPGEGFPYEPISDKAKSLIVAHCGGEPIDDVDCVRGFLAYSGVPVVKHYPVWQLILNTRLATIDPLGLETDNSMLAFNRGAYFYAGLLNDVAGIKKVTLDDSVVAKVNEDLQDRPLDFGLELYESSHTIPSFEEVFEPYRSLLVGDNDPDKTTAMLGASTVHYLFTESLARSADPDKLSVSHPELSDLSDIFKELPPN